MQRNSSPDTKPNCLELHPAREQWENEQNGQEGQDQQLIKLFSLLPTLIQEFCFLEVEWRCSKRKNMRSESREGHCWYLLSKDTHPLFDLETLWLCSCQMYFSKARGACVSSCIRILFSSAHFIGKKSDTSPRVSCTDPAQLRCRQEYCRDLACWGGNERKPEKRDCAFI